MKKIKKITRGRETLMARPRKCRWVEFEPGITFFKPQGIPMRGLEQVVISVDELEALRLSDFLGLNQEDVALEMNVSRPQCADAGSGSPSCAEALVYGKAIKSPGDYQVTQRRICQDCEHAWEDETIARIFRKPPKCQGSSIQRFF
jgi:predicted DNA-binding protein (UPF0251 family)